MQYGRDTNVNWFVVIACLSLRLYTPKFGFRASRAK